MRTYRLFYYFRNFIYVLLVLLNPFHIMVQTLKIDSEEVPVDHLSTAQSMTSIMGIIGYNKIIFLLAFRRRSH